MTIHVLRKVRKKHYKSDGLQVDIDAERLTNAIIDAAHDKIVQNMESGLEPDGTPKPRPRGKSHPRGVTKHRRFIRSVGKRKAKGRLRAKGAITYAAFFTDWLMREQQRGVNHFDLPEKEIDQAIADALNTLIQ